VKRGRFLFEINRGFGARAPQLDGTEVQFLPMEKIGEKNDIILDSFRLNDPSSNSYVAVLEDDLMIAKVTPCFENGKGAVARGLKAFAGLATSEVHTLRSKSAVSPDFLYYSTLNSVYRQAGAAEMYGVGGLRRVPPIFFKDSALAVPTHDEQKAIVTYLNITLYAMDSAISSQERMIELLKERRSAIITQAITGQIDVR
jgi:type I restriction enzyme S subunit